MTNRQVIQTKIKEKSVRMKQHYLKGGNLTDTYPTFHLSTKNIPSQQLIELFPKLTTYSNTKPVSVDIRKPCILSDHHGLKLGIDNKTNSRKLNNSELNENWVKAEEGNLNIL